MANLLRTLKYYKWQRIMYSKNRIRFLELYKQSSFEEAMQLIAKEPDENSRTKKIKNPSNREIKNEYRQTSSKIIHHSVSKI
jgi:hypothetical protein